MPESTRQRQAFERYWRLGGRRSLLALHAVLAAEGRAPSLRTLEAWSGRFHWQDRLADLERAAMDADDHARIAALREMAERHAKEALLLQQKGAEWLASMEAREVTADAAIRALVEGAKLERLARGEVTERTESRAEDSRLEGLTDDELGRLIAAAEGALERALPAPPGERPRLDDGASPGG